MGSGGSTTPKSPKIEARVSSPQSDLSSRCDRLSNSSSLSKPKEKVEKTPIKRIQQSEVKQECLVTHLKQNLEEREKSNEDKDIIIKDLEEKCITQDKQMGELECSNLDLQDRIHQLEDALKCSQTTRALGSVVEESEKPNEQFCPETLQAKNKYIEQLEKETEQWKMETKKVKIRCKRKLRALSAQLSELKQAHSVEMMEINLESDKNGSTQGELGANTHLVIELSSKVNEQETEIAELRQKLSNKKIIQLPENESPQLLKSESASSEMRHWTLSCVSDIINNASELLHNANDNVPSSQKTHSTSKDKSRILSAMNVGWSSDDDDDTKRKASTVSSLDPSSLRRISAPKDRRRRTKNQQQRCQVEVKLTETEDLIQSLEHQPEMPAVY